MFSDENTKANAAIDRKFVVRVVITIDDQLAGTGQQSMTIRTEAPQHHPISNLMIFCSNILNRLKC